MTMALRPHDRPMDILREPRVTLLARPQFLEPAHLPVQWKGESTDGERLAEFAGRLCYMSQHNPAGRTTAEYLRNILQQGHGSVFEHSTYVVLIEGISPLLQPRAGAPPRRVGLLAALPALRGRVARRLRHAAGDPGRRRRSRPSGPGRSEAAQAAYVTAVERLMARYEWVEDKVHRRKMAREAARSVLPNATEVKIVASANVRAWRTMLELRLGEGAELEIRRMAVACLRLLQQEAPALFADFEIYQAERRERGGTGGVSQGVRGEGEA